MLPPESHLQVGVRSFRSWTTRAEGQAYVTDEQFQRCDVFSRQAEGLFILTHNILLKAGLWDVVQLLHVYYNLLFQGHELSMTPRLQTQMTQLIVDQRDENDQPRWERGATHTLEKITMNKIKVFSEEKTLFSLYLLCILGLDVLVEVLQLFHRGDRVCCNAIRRGAQDVAQVLILLQQRLQPLHPSSLLLHQSLQLSAHVLLLLEHADALFLLKEQLQFTKLLLKISDCALKRGRQIIFNALTSNMGS